MLMDPGDSRRRLETSFRGVSMFVMQVSAVRLGAKYVSVRTFVLFALCNYIFGVVTSPLSFPSKSQGPRPVPFISIHLSLASTIEIVALSESILLGS